MGFLFLQKIYRFFGFLIVFTVPTVVFAAPFFSNDTFIKELWYLDAIHVPETPQEGKQSVIAILDAGFDLNHEDLVNQYWKNINEIPGDQIDNDHNGYEDDMIGWDFEDGDADPSPVITKDASDSVVSHGTILAGIIAAESMNARGIAGIAPRSKIMPLRILDSRGVGTTTAVREAIEYAVLNGADVINLSLLSKKPDELLEKKIAWAVDQGVVVVAGIGNENTDTDKAPTYPACFDTRLEKNMIIGVAAIDQKGKRASFSNYGKNCVDISAPGVDFFGSVYHDPSELLYSTAYGSPWEGTSMATPVVSAAVARLRSAYPTLTPNQIRLSLMLSTDPSRETTVSENESMGAGRLNLDRALKTAAVFASGGSRVGETNRKPSGSMVVAQGAGSAPMVKRVNQQGKELASFFAYDKKFRGGVRLAMGDVTGDGVEEIVTAPGKGGGPQIRVFDLKGNVLNQFFAYETSDRLGVFVAVGDLNQDGVDEILVSQGEGGNGQVRIFNRKGEMQGAFYPFGRTRVPVHVAVGNFDDDVAAEIVATLGGKDLTHVVKIFDANGQYIREFKAFAMEGVGLNVSVIHAYGEKIDFVILASEPGSSPWFAVYDAFGAKMYASLAYSERFFGGVKVISGDIDRNGTIEIYTAPGSRGGPHIRIFNSSTDLIGGFFPFESKNRFGLNIAIWNE